MEKFKMSAFERVLKSGLINHIEQLEQMKDYILNIETKVGTKLDDKAREAYASLDQAQIDLTNFTRLHITRD